MVLEGPRFTRNLLQNASMHGINLIDEVSGIINECELVASNYVGPSRANTRSEVIAF